MRIQVQHATRYRYGEPVHLEPHWIRMHPRCDGSVRVERWETEVSPEPAGRSFALDAHGNTVERIWFGAAPAQELAVNIRFEAETLRSNPFDFLLPPPQMLALPLTFGGAERALLAPYLEGEPVAPAVADFAREIAAQAGGQLMPFLDALTRRIRTGWKHTVRPEGPPYEPERALGASELACRDAAVLFRAACQAAGVAARFVSGYELHMQNEPNYLHAWAEAWVPGGGWRGYDPSRGSATALLHVPVAAALHPEDAAPISGTFRGSGRAQMQVALQVTGCGA